MLACAICFIAQIVTAKDIILLSPDKHISIRISVDENIRWEVSRDGQALISPSLISMSFSDGQILGKNPKLIKQKNNEVNNIVQAIVPVKQAAIINHFNEIQLDFKGDYSVLFRAYNEGVAYRFVTKQKNAVEVLDEQADFNFPSNYRVFWSNEENKEFQSHFESKYTDGTLAAYDNSKHAALPLLVQAPNGVNLLISESDLVDYPNLFLFGTGGNALKSGFPKVIQKSEPIRDRGIKITQLAPYHAKTSGDRTFPWRSVTIAPHDKDLLETNLTYLLAEPSKIEETSWIKPGKVAWDWWNFNNIYGVDFRAGVNTQTYKYYIDFAAKYGLEYIMLDEGWTKSTTNLLEMNPDIDVKELIRYGASKNVGVWLWCLWGPLDKDMEKILDLYASWGAVGIKVDFMARADQYMVNFYERVAKESAKRKIMVDLHGSYKPVGLNRTYPNVLTYEGVRGLENNKWESTITPVHNTTLPFIRMAAGPMDYTPGAMLNASKKNFSIVFEAPMSMTTRAQQVAMYTIYESPLQMLSDNPSNYLKDPVCTEFIAQIPSVWDETIALEGKVGEYVAMARRKGNTWYVAAMNDWKPRELTVSLPFLKGDYKVSYLKDGINADRHAADYKVGNMVWSEGLKLSIPMAAGGGWSAVFTK